MKLIKTENMKYLLGLFGVISSCSWRVMIVPCGIVTLLGAFAIHPLLTIGLAVGLCVGSLGEKLRWWDN
jgi:hypothetical protein